MESYVLKVLKNSKECSIATFSDNFIDNATISFYSEDYNIYFGAYDFTTKCKFIERNSLVALAVKDIQIHGICTKICRNSPEYKRILDKYLEKFPYYNMYFNFNNNNLYKVNPLVIWVYNKSSKTMQRDKIVFDNEYYKKLKPYDYNEYTQLDWMKNIDDGVR